MPTERQQNPVSRSLALAVFSSAFLFLCSVNLAGCSEAPVKEPAPKQSVVQDLDIQSDTDSQSAADGSSEKKEESSPKDEIESLPFEPQELEKNPEEKQLPVLEE